MVNLRPNLRLHRAALLLALVATLAAQGEVAHGHGGALERPLSVAAVSEAPHEAAECAACAIQSQRQGQLITPAVSLAPSPPRRIALLASEWGDVGSRRHALPPERGPPQSA